MLAKKMFLGLKLPGIAVALALSVAAVDVAEAQVRKVFDQHRWTLDDVDPQFVISANLQWLAIRQSQQMRLLNLITTGESLNQELATSTAAAFTPDSEAVWWALPSSTLVRQDLNAGGMTDRLLLQADGPVKSMTIDPRGRWLAYAAGDGGGLIDLRNGDVLLKLDSVSSASLRQSRMPLLRFDANGDHLFFDPMKWEGLRVAGHDDGAVVVWNIEQRKVVGRQKPYVSFDTHGYVVDDSSVIYGNRVDGKYRIRRRNFLTGEDQVLDEEARRGHFLDLFLSPDKRFVVEWDFEKNGVRVYDLAGDLPVQDLGQGADRSQRLAFLGFDNSDRSCLWLSGPGRSGMDLWDPVKGKMVLRSVILDGVRVLRTERAFGGRKLILRSTTDPQNRSFTYHLDLYESVW